MFSERHVQKQQYLQGFLQHTCKNSNIYKVFCKPRAHTTIFTRFSATQMQTSCEEKEIWGRKSDSGRESGMADRKLVLGHQNPDFAGCHFPLWILHKIGDIWLETAKIGTFQNLLVLACACSCSTCACSCLSVNGRARALAHSPKSRFGRVSFPLMNHSQNRWYLVRNA